MVTNSTDTVSMTCGDANTERKVTKTPVQYLTMDTEDLHLERAAISQSSQKTNGNSELVRKLSELSIRSVQQTQPDKQKSGVLKRMRKGFKALGEQMAPLVEPLDVLKQNLESLTDPHDGGLLQSLSFLAEPLSVFRQNISPVLELFDVLKQNLESLLDSHREIPDYKMESASHSSTSVVTGSRFEDGKGKSSGCGSSLKEGGRSDPRNEVLMKESSKLNRELSDFFSSLDDNKNNKAENFSAGFGKRMRKGFVSLRDNARPVTKPLLVCKQNIESVMDPVYGPLGKKLVFLAQPFHVFGQNMESLIESLSKRDKNMASCVELDQSKPVRENRCNQGATATPSVWWSFFNKKRVAPECSIACCETVAGGKNGFLEGAKMSVGDNGTDVLQDKQLTDVMPTTYKIFAA